jgi:hypothetical protein
MRYHHHLGDGASDRGLIYAHNFWRSNGMSETYFVPCLAIKADGVTCEPYTHYPPGPYVFSSALLSSFELFFTEGRALVLARMVIYLFVLAGISFALLQIATFAKLPLAATLLLSAVFGLWPGFIIYADSLFGHGMALALQFLCLGHVLARPAASKKDISIYFCLSTVVFWWNLEPLFFFLIAPCLLLLTGASSLSAVKKYFLAAAFAFAIGVVFRIVQNSMVMGGFSALLDDWTKVFSQRVAGAEIGLVDFVEEQLRYQRIMISKWGQLWLISVSAFLLFTEPKKAALLVATYFAAISWNFVFIEHSMIHLYTAKAVLIPFALSICLALAWLAQKLSSLKTVS